MTSVDSGVETGNDSNDSLVAQHDNLVSGQAHNGTTMNTSTAGGHIEEQERERGNPSFDVGPIKPLAAICSGLENTTSSDSQNTFGAGTSGPLVLRSNVEPLKVLEFRIPPMYNSSEQLLSTMDLFKSSSCYQRKMRRRNYYRVTWRGFQAPRKMRLAAATNNIEMMRRLLSGGISPNNQDDQGRTPLHLASCRGYAEMVALLLEYGADPNQRDCIGNTPLHLAAVTSKISVVTLLLKAGTDVLSSDQHGYNPLQIAQTKIRILQNCKGSDMIRIKEEVHNVIGMLLAYLQKQKDAREQVEALSSICSRLSLSNTSDEVQGDVRDLLANIGSLSLTS